MSPQIASVGEVPQDVMVATGRYAGLLPWNIDREFPQAQQWLENKFPPWAFSILEDWAAGAFDDYEAVVFSRGDDSAHRLYYYICELQRRGLIKGPTPVVFDVAHIGRATSEAHCIAAVHQLAAQLGVTEKALEKAIGDTNQRRASMQNMLRTSPVCLLDGSAPSDHRLHRVVQNAGWSCAGETLAEQWARLGGPVAAGVGDPIAAVGKQVYAEQTGPRAFVNRSEWIVREVQRVGAKAVVLWFIEEDEAQIWHLPAQRKALEAAGVPTLVLTRCNMRANDGADAKIGAFLKGLQP
jgi:hypothetical protein